MSVAPARPGDKITLNADGTLSGQARGVPFAKDAKHLAVLAGSSVALVETGACRLSDGVNLAGEPQNTVTFDKVKPVAVAPANVDPTVLMLMGCVVRSLQTAGALQAVLDHGALFHDPSCSSVRSRSGVQPIFAARRLCRGGDDRRHFRRGLHSACRHFRRPRLPRSCGGKILFSDCDEVGRSPIRCTARSALPTSTSCIVHAAHAGLGDDCGTEPLARSGRDGARCATSGLVASPNGRPRS